LTNDGPNELHRAEATSSLEILGRQFKSLVIWVLIGAAVVSAALGETVDGIAIVTIVVLNALIGFFQEYRAEQAVAALARLAAPRARVLRDGHAAVLPAHDIVRGDVLVLDGGDLVAADARLLEASALRVNEAPLTGESEAVEKRAGRVALDTPLAERRNMLFLGTSVVAGSGRAVVVATGMATEVGRIAHLLGTARAGETPLKRRLDQVARRLLWVCIAIVALVFILGARRGIAPFELFLGAVSLAVAAIPEGLPAVVTIALALGVSRMARRHALVRRLAAVETLGSAEVICTDKTGTLTVGEMSVRTVVTAERVLAVTGGGYATDGSFLSEGVEIDPNSDPLLRDLLRGAVACADAELGVREARTVVTGDPTEGALLVAAAKAGIRRELIEVEMPRLGTLPFDSERKRMTVLRRLEGRPWAFVKGAPEVILQRCTSLRTTRGVSRLGESDRARMLEASAILANDALRVLAIAERPLDAAAARADPARDATAIEQELTLLGLVGMQDPPRDEARDCVARCKRAGIRVVMITGDHLDTARAIARELGILAHGDLTLGATELEGLTDGELADRVEHVTVFARVTAEHKLRIVRAWKARGAVVAMTGDGVNDAPALKEASIGIAMGITGTEVAKQSADMVITDDDFASIVAAVEEGRGIYDNIVKTLGYLLGGNAGELAVMLVAVLLGWPLPLLPIQLLWINLVTDGLPALALATDPIEPGVLSRPPRPSGAEIMDRSFIVLLCFTGVLTATAALGTFAYELQSSGSVAAARNAAFSVLVFDELARSFSARSATRTIFEIGLLSNLRLLSVVAASFGLQVAIQNSPVTEHLFGTEPVSLLQCAAWVGVGLVPLAALELTKVVRRRLARAPSPI
jgi:Ca2+-transporting ATPase